MKNKIITLSLAAAISLNALTLDEMNQEFKKNEIKTEKKSLYKKKFQYKYFANVSKETMDLYIETKKLLLIGDLPNAKKIAMKLFNKTNSLSNTNEDEKQLANIALGYVYEEYGEKYKWKFIHLSALSYYDKLSNKVESIYGILELKDILIEKNKDNLQQLKESMLKINSFLGENKDNFEEKNYIYLKMKLNSIMAEIEFRQNNLKGAVTWLEKEDSELKRLYTYYSLNEARLIYRRAFYTFNLTGETDKTLNELKTSYYISKKILDNMNMSERSVFLADTYLFMGKILSSGTKQEESLDYFKEAIKIYKYNGLKEKEVEARFQLINTYKIMGQMNKAEKDTDQIIKIIKDYFGDNSPSYADAIISKADIINSNGKYKKAMKLMEEAKKIYVDNFGKYSKEVKMINSTINYIKSQSDF